MLSESCAEYEKRANAQIAHLVINEQLKDSINPLCPVLMCVVVEVMEKEEVVI